MNREKLEKILEKGDERIVRLMSFEFCRKFDFLEETNRRIEESVMSFASDENFGALKEINEMVGSPVKVGYLFLISSLYEPREQALQVLKKSFAYQKIGVSSYDSNGVEIFKELYFLLKM